MGGPTAAPGTEKQPLRRPIPDRVTWSAHATLGMLRNSVLCNPGCAAPGVRLFLSSFLAVAKYI